MVDRGIKYKRPLIPSEVKWTKTTEETFSVFKMVKRLQQEFGRICHSYVISMSHSASDLLEVLLLAKRWGLLIKIHKVKIISCTSF